MRLGEEAPGLMLRAQPVVEGRRIHGHVRHGRFEIVVAVNAGDLFQNIHRQRNVLGTAERRNADRHDAVRGVCFEAEPGQDGDDPVRGDRVPDAPVEERDRNVQPARLVLQFAPIRKTGAGPGVQPRLAQEMQKARNRRFRVGGRLLLLEPLTGVGVYPEPGRGPPDTGVPEIRAFEQQAGRRRADLAVQAAHDTGQRDRLALVPDHQVVGLHCAVLPVQGRKTAACAERGDAHRTQPAAVERVHGLAEFQHDVVGEIDQDVERALSQGVQTSLQRQGRGPRRYPVHLDAAVAGAVLRIIDR